MIGGTRVRRRNGSKGKHPVLEDPPAESVPVTIACRKRDEVLPNIYAPAEAQPRSATLRVPQLPKNADLDRLDARRSSPIRTCPPSACSTGARRASDVDGEFDVAYTARSDACAGSARRTACSRGQAAGSSAGSGSSRNRHLRYCPSERDHGNAGMAAARLRTHADLCTTEASRIEELAMLTDAEIAQTGPPVAERTWRQRNPGLYRGSRSKIADSPDAGDQRRRGPHASGCIGGTRSDAVDCGCNQVTTSFAPADGGKGGCRQRLSGERNQRNWGGRIVRRGETSGSPFSATNTLGKRPIRTRAHCLHATSEGRCCVHVSAGTRWSRHCTDIHKGRCDEFVQE